MVTIQVKLRLVDVDHCHGCALLRVPNNPEMKLRTGGHVMCLKGYHFLSEAIDVKASEEAGRLIIVRPDVCSNVNEEVI